VIRAVKSITQSAADSSEWLLVLICGHEVFTATTSFHVLGTGCGSPPNVNLSRS